MLEQTVFQSFPIHETFINWLFDKFLLQMQELAETFHNPSDGPLCKALHCFASTPASRAGCGVFGRSSMLWNPDFTFPWKRLNLKSVRYRCGPIGAC